MAVCPMFTVVKVPWGLDVSVKDETNSDRLMVKLCQLSLQQAEVGIGCHPKLKDYAVVSEELITSSGGATVLSTVTPQIMVLRPIAELVS